VCLEDPHGFAGLDEQRLVGFEPLQRLDDAIVTVPVARRAPDAAIHDEILGPFRDRRVEVVHEHAQWRFGEPAFRGERGAPGGMYHA
jgi:hypothetical protein